MMIQRVSRRFLESDVRDINGTHLMEARSNTSTASTAVSSRRMRAASQAVFMCGNITNVDACSTVKKRQEVVHETDQ